jgi:hypothetical protein
MTVRSRRLPFAGLLDGVQGTERGFAIRIFFVRSSNHARRHGQIASRPGQRIYATAGDTSTTLAVERANGVKIPYECDGANAVLA